MAWTDPTQRDPDAAPRVRLEALDLVAIAPVLRLLSTFRMAIQPGKLALGLLLTVLVYLFGLGLDVAFGPQVAPYEVQAYLTHASPPVMPGPDKEQGVFQTLLSVEVGAFEDMTRSAASLDFGLRNFLSGRGMLSGGVIGALLIMVVGVPGWMLESHPLYLSIFLTGVFVLLCVLGGAISRMAAAQACENKTIGIGEGVAFSWRFGPWFFLAPAIPLAIVGLLGLLLSGVGLLFNAPGLDVVGALLFGLAIPVGLVMAVLLLGLAMAGNLMFPAVAVEAGDALDAISRSYNYAVGRPLRFIAYTVVLVVYGAATYALVGLVVFTAIYLTHAWMGWWVLREVGGESAMTAMMPQPTFGRLASDINWTQLQGSTTTVIAAAILGVWTKLLIALLPAYAVSYYFSAQTWVYLLLRRAADGTGFHQWTAPERDAATQTPDKVEPEAGP